MGDFEEIFKVLAMVGGIVSVGVGGLWGLLGAVRHHRSWELRTRAPRPAVDAPREMAALNERMTRLEHGFEAVAIEMERVGEGQGFLTRVLTDGRAAPAPQRSTTPVA